MVDCTGLENLAGKAPETAETAEFCGSEQAQDALFTDRSAGPDGTKVGTGDPLEAVIRPIVEGQLRSFTFDHPEVLSAVDWFRPRKDRRQTFVNSVAKRIMRDLLCAGNRARLVQAATATPSGAADEGVSSVSATRGAEHCISAPADGGILTPVRARSGAVKCR